MIPINKEILSIVDDAYSQVPMQWVDQSYLPMNQKIHVFKECIQILETQNLKLHENLKWPALNNQELQKNIVVVEEALQKGKK